MTSSAGSPLGLNWQIILPVLSGCILAVGLGMTLCLVVALIYGEAVAAFVISGGVALPLGGIGLLYARSLPASLLRPRDTLFAVTMAWLLSAAVGAIPFLLYGTFDGFVDAFFESMSGFTTTGATLLSDIEQQPHAILMWRSLTQWFGGIGIVVLFVAVAPATGLASQRAFYAETTGPIAERLTPRIADTAKILWTIYASLTALGFVALWIAGMGAFDSINHIFTTVATGGFSTRDASVGAFDSVTIEVVLIFFMMLAGVNFAVYWKLLRGRRSLWPQMAEVRAYVLIIAGAVALTTGVLLVAGDVSEVGSALRQSAFQVVSITTTTGYTTADFDGWSDLIRLSLLVLMFVGGCAGSTAGGMKVVRVQLLAKSGVHEIRRHFQPASVAVLRIKGRVFSEDVRQSVLGFFVIYISVFAAATLVMSATGLDPTSAASSVAATLNVIGPGLGEVGAAESYGAVSATGRWVLAACMLIGRLEIFTVLVLLTPAFWRRQWR